MAGETPRSTIIQCLIFLLLLFTFLAIVAGIILMIIFIPRAPKINVVSLSVSPITLISIDDDHRYYSNFFRISATWNIELFVRNPNDRATISYNDVHLYIYHKNAKLSSQKLGFFKQYPNTEDYLAGNLTKPGHVSKRDMKLMIMDVDEDHVVDFNVKLRGKVRVYSETKFGINHVLSFNCYNVKVEFSPENGTGWMLGPSKKCYKTNLVF